LFPPLLPSPAAATSVINVVLSFHPLPWLWTGSSIAWREEQRDREKTARRKKEKERKEKKREQGIVTKARATAVLAARAAEVTGSVV
jgi:hypothetical protein